MELMNRAENQSQGGSPPSSTIINFGELSNDVLLHIFSMCSARTVAQLRQSCKQLRRLSNDQTVWLAVLKTTCTELSLPVPTFLQKAFSRSDIELLATSWIRFQWVLRNAKDAQVPTPRMVRRIGIIERVYSLELSPDGQFLFILTSSGIQIYTLQSPSPILVASFAIDIPEDGWAALISLIEDNHSFIIFLHVVARLPRQEQWSAFRFRFSNKGREEFGLTFLSEFDQLRFSATRWGLLALQPTLPVMATAFQRPLTGKHYLLWDFVRGSCATWAADEYDTDLKTSIVIIRGFFISFDKTTHTMVVYTLPELPSRSSYAPEICANLSNPALLHVPAETSRRNLQTVFAVHFNLPFTGTYLASDYDSRASLCDVGDGSWTLERTGFCRTDSPSSQFSPLPLTVERSHCLHITEPQSFPLPKDKSADAYIYPNLNLLLYSTTNDRMQMVFHISAPTEDGRGVELGKGVLHRSSDVLNINDRLHSLSPFAGRLCVTTSDGVEVIDFVESAYL